MVLVRNDRPYGVRTDFGYFGPQEVRDLSEADAAVLAAQAGFGLVDAPSPSAETETPKDEPTSLQCDFCDHPPYKTESGLKNHLETKHPEENR